ncbi:MAG: hypothetical protein EBT71_02585 [Alphaproteobacteria bacterium]|nr:hypothetical protein [Alphaproteobacteria bacterium]
MAKDAEAGVVVVDDVIDVITRLFCTRLILGSTRSKAHILVTCREDPHERRHNLLNGVSKLLADNLTFALNLVAKWLGKVVIQRLDALCRKLLVVVV